MQPRNHAPFTGSVPGDATLAAIKALLDAVLSETETSLGVKLDSIKTVVDAVLLDTETTLEGKLDTLDLLINTIKAVTDNIPDGGSLTALLASIASILADTGTTIPGLLATIQADLDNPDQYKADVAALALEATLTAIKGAGWTTETLVAIKAAVDAIPTTAERGTDNALLAADYTAPDNAGIATLLTRITAAVALASALTTHDTDIKVLLATIAGYLDTEIAAILAAVDTEVAAIETKLDTPTNFMANLTTLETRLSALRAGYLDELAAANLPTDIAALATSQGRMLFSMDFWSDPVEEKAVTAAQVTAAVGAAVVVADLPAGATVVRAIVMMKFRMVENTNVAENSLDCTAVQPIQVDDSGNTGWVTAIDFVDEQFKIAASTREGGDVLIGDNDVAARVDGNDTYDFQWLNAKAHLGNIQFNDIQMGIRIWYSV